jgi:HD-like signal output (HDOD) protein
MNAMESTLDPEVLRYLGPFRNLSPRSLQRLASRLACRQAPAGHVLIERGSNDDLTYFLIKGRLELRDAGGNSHELEGGTVKARSPVSFLRPRQYRATALTPIVYLCVDNHWLERLLTESRATTGEVEEVLRGDRLQQNALFRELYQDLIADRLSLPSLPDVALRVRKAVADEDAKAETVARAVSADPAIAAKLIRAANSAAYRGIRPVETCTAAVVHLGFNVTRQLVTSFVMREVFSSPSAALKERMRALWEHSTEVAATSYVLAHVTPHVDPEQALLAGLVHDIGIVPVLAYAERFAGRSAEPQLLERIIDELRAQIGGMLLRKWKFGEHMITAAVESEDWLRDPNPEPDYCDVVLVAQLHCFLGSERTRSIPPMVELPAFNKLALGKLTPQRSLKLMMKAKAQIAETRSLLGD